MVECIYNITLLKIRQVALSYYIIVTGDCLVIVYPFTTRICRNDMNESVMPFIL